MPMQVEMDGDYIQIPVNGPTNLDEVGEHDLFCMDHLSSRAIITFIAETGIEREHTADSSEYSITVRGSEIVTADFQTLPYGANPRNPVLCPEFDKIFTTITNDVDEFVLLNSGIDVFCETAELNDDDSTVSLVFSNERHGIANGGLTTSVIRYSAEMGVDLEDLRVSVRIWAGDLELEILSRAADARNTHRELELADRLNQLGAFEHIKESLNEDWREHFSFHTGDVEAQAHTSQNIGELCHLLYGFTTSPGEGHPTKNPNPPMGVPPSIKKKGRLTSPKDGISGMKDTVGI